MVNSEDQTFDAWLNQIAKEQYPDLFARYQASKVEYERLKEAHTNAENKHIVASSLADSLESPYVKRSDAAYKEYQEAVNTARELKEARDMVIRHEKSIDLKLGEAKRAEDQARTELENAGKSFKTVKEEHTKVKTNLESKYRMNVMKSIETGSDVEAFLNANGVKPPGWMLENITDVPCTKAGIKLFRWSNAQNTWNKPTRMGYLAFKGLTLVGFLTVEPSQHAGDVSSYLGMMYDDALEVPIEPGSNEFRRNLSLQQYRFREWKAELLEDSAKTVGLNLSNKMVREVLGNWSAYSYY